MGAKKVAIFTWKELWNGTKATLLIGAVFIFIGATVAWLFRLIVRRDVPSILLTFIALLLLAIYFRLGDLLDDLRSIDRRTERHWPTKSEEEARLFVESEEESSDD